MKLTNRLAMVADMVDPCDHFVDIGTDHAYLPAYLLQTARVKTALACDLRPQPLQNAAKTVTQYQLENSLSLRLSDGLQNVQPQEADVIAIAGMGGLLIAQMIAETPWLQSKDKTLLLQPMTHEEDVRKALSEHQFEIVEERTAQEGKHLYLCMKAKYTGEEQPQNDVFYYFGTLPAKKTETDVLYQNKIRQRLLKRATALRSIEPATAEQIDKILEESCPC